MRFLRGHPEEEGQMSIILGVIILIACVIAAIYGVSKLDELLSRRERGLPKKRKQKKIGKKEDE
jgi:hypothetical protein